MPWAAVGLRPTLALSRVQTPCEPTADYVRANTKRSTRRRADGGWPLPRHGLHVQKTNGLHEFVLPTWPIARAWAKRTFTARPELVHDCGADSRKTSNHRTQILKAASAKIQVIRFQQQTVSRSHAHCKRTPHDSCTSADGEWASLESCHTRARARRLLRTSSSVTRRRLCQLEPCEHFVGACVALLARRKVPDTSHLLRPTQSMTHHRTSQYERQGLTPAVSSVFCDRNCCRHEANCVRPGPLGQAPPALVHV